MKTRHVRPGADLFDVLVTGHEHPVSVTLDRRRFFFAAVRARPAPAKYRFGPQAAGLPGLVDLGQHRVGLLLHIRDQPSLGCRVEVARAPAHNWFGCQQAGGGLAAHQVFDEGMAHAEASGYGRQSVVVEPFANLL